MTEPHLKYCPFCGSKPIWTNDRYGQPSGGQQVSIVPRPMIFCNKCNLEMTDRSQIKLIEKWNQRQFNAS